MWHQLLDFAVVVLPFALSLLGVHMSATLSNKAKWFLVFCGFFVSALVWIQQADSRRAHDKEINEQKIAMDGLKLEIQTSEIRNAGDLGYMRAKLEDSERLNEKYAPAIILLAKTSAEFMQKQYEVKVTSDKDLYTFTMGVVGKLRALSQKYRALEEKESDTLMASISQRGITDTERQQRWNAAGQKTLEISRNKDNEFRSSILPDALFAKQEMMRRKLSEPTMPQGEKDRVDMALVGVLFGPNSELSLANYLELMAKPLSRKLTP